MRELENLDQFPFVEAKMLVDDTDLEKRGIGVNQSDHQPETVPVERIISAVGALSWKDTFSSIAGSSLPEVYIEALVKGEIKPSNGPVLLVQHQDVFIAYSMGWRIALAKLKGLEEIEALILCYD